MDQGDRFSLVKPLLTWDFPDFCSPVVGFGIRGLGFCYFCARKIHSVCRWAEKFHTFVFGSQCLPSRPFRFTFSFAVSPCLHSFFQAMMRNQETWCNLAERRLCLEWEAQMYKEHFRLMSHIHVAKCE